MAWHIVPSIPFLCHHPNPLAKNALMNTQSQNAFVPDPGELPTIDAQAMFPKPLDIRLAPDMKRDMPPLRPLHGVTNYAPLGGIAMDYPLDARALLQDLHLPYAYFHDDVYVSSGKDVIDVSRIFPLFGADENDPANYWFAETDDYLRQVVDDGLKVIYRLGESIECGENRYRTFPPKDFGKWTRICLNIIRHYTEGWADGFHWDMQDWAVWEEPNNPNLWHGPFEDYLRLYKLFSVEFKAAFPHLHVGGPSTTTLGYRFLEQFLTFVEAERLPLDFVNYTAYYLTPAEFLSESVKRREMMDCHGFANIPLWTTEWHCSPFWHDFADPVAYGRERCRFGGTEGAAFAAVILCGLQDTPVQRACFYSAHIGGGYGLLDMENRPTPTYHVFRIFSRLFMDSVRRVALDIQNASSNTQAILSQNRHGDLELFSGCFSRVEGTLTFQIPAGFTVKEIRILDDLGAADFREPEAGRIALEGGACRLRKYACATAFHLRLERD